MHHFDLQKNGYFVGVKPNSSPSVKNHCLLLDFFKGINSLGKLFSVG